MYETSLSECWINPLLANHDYNRLKFVLADQITVIGNEMSAYTSIFQMFGLKLNKYE